MSDEPLVARIHRALHVAVSYGGIDGDHHKAWVIDQMVRALTGCKPGEAVSDDYTKLVAEACDGEDGPETYFWDEGCPP